MITLGEYSYNAKQDIDCYEGVNLTIGKYCSVGSGLKIYSGTHPCIEYPKEVSTYPFQAQFGWDDNICKTGGFVTIGNDVWIATDVGILEGVTIGDGAILGARAMITKDVPPYAFVAGNPARVKHFRFTDDVIQSLLRIKWWDWDKDKIKQAMPEMKDIIQFLVKYEPIKIV
jgi:chloramphenicol O-acetyltransferase type B